MAEIRGEKICFRKQDIVALHELPSAQAEDPLIVHCPPPRSRFRRFAKAFCVAALGISMAGVGVGLAVESGVFDETLSSRATAALNKAIGPRYEARVGSAVVRFTSNLRLALEAREVDILESESGRHLTKTSAIRMALDPLSLASGQPSIDNIEAEGIMLDAALLPAGDPLDLAGMRVDSIPTVMEHVFAHLDEALMFVDRNGTSSVDISDFGLRFAQGANVQPITLAVEQLGIRREEDGTLALSGALNVNGHAATLAVRAENSNGKNSALIAEIDDLILTPFLLKRTQDGVPREGIDGSIDLRIVAEREREGISPKLSAGIRHGAGNFYFDTVPQQITGAEINIAYDFPNRSILVEPSRAVLGPTRLPVTGAITDLDRLNPETARPGFGIDLLVSGGVASADSSGETPAVFDLAVTGRYYPVEKELLTERLLVSSPLGDMAGTLRMRFGEQSPEISFGAQLPRMNTTGVKQLWPFWMARKPRDWVQTNIYGGTVTNGSISVFIPAGRLRGPGFPLELDENELRISFDIDDARINVTGEIPPLRDLKGHFDLKGERMEVTNASAISYFPSGRVVTVEEGAFTIASTYSKPLMADMKLAISGSADALTELAGFHPVNALKNTSYRPEDFSGMARAELQARFGLISDQNPPDPDWLVKIGLKGVDVAAAVDGRKVTGLDGTLTIDTQAAVLAATGQMDGVPMEIALTEPIDKKSEVVREQNIKLTLNGAQREKLVPGLSDILDGTVVAELKRVDEKRQAVSVDLTRAALSVPVVGWTKGEGIAARARFELSDSDGQTVLRNFELAGDGFGANGSIILTKNGLVSADFKKMRLSPADDFAVSVKLAKSTYDVNISGSSADIRSLISKFRAVGGGTDTGGRNVAVKARLDRLIGFNDESVSNVNASFVLRGSQVEKAEFSGVTGSGQAIVVQTTQNGGRNIISITSGDAGAVIRFVDIYRNMRGGLLNLAIGQQEGGNWNGSIDIRSFSVVNEQRLQSMVSAPVGENGRSLNNAVKRDIDVSSEKFQRGFARLSYRNGALGVENGVVRGEQIGATFQGTVKDARGNMELTGTFMPAYGLNRIFGELPLIGVILGNGRDRGLLGITFKLTGKSDSPNLMINPLSLIAPGVFRQIFEFQ